MDRVIEDRPRLTTAEDLTASTSQFDKLEGMLEAAGEASVVPKAERS